MFKIATQAMTVLAVVGLAPAAYAHGDEKHEVVYSASTTTIGTLMDNPETLAVLQKHVPGLVSHPGLAQARNMTLLAVQGYAADMLTPEAMTAINADLAKIDGA